MNDVFLQGEVVSIREQEHASAQAAHLVFQLRVTHYNAQHQRKHDDFTINAWSNLARWARMALRVGDRVVVRGYLTYRTIDGQEATEVTAEKVLHTQLPSPAPTAGESGK